MPRSDDPPASDAVPARLPHEPDRRGAGPLGLLARLALQAPLLALAALAVAPLGLLYLATSARFGWAPNTVRLHELARYLRATWTEQPPAPGLSTLRRCWITRTLLLRAILAPIQGLAWHLDELLYGRALDAVKVQAPLLEISAGRSGSTQLARYLEADPQLAAPSLLQTFFPYLWLWRLAGATLGRRIPRDRVRAWVASALPPEFLERHEVDPFGTDTFEGAPLTAHLADLAFALGPEATCREFSLGRAGPHNRGFWEGDFVAFLDRVARKTLLEAGPGRRFFVKGHFLAAAGALAARYPDGRFLAVVRDPAPRMRSAITYLWTNPVDPALGPVPWAWLGAAVSRAETVYCQEERAWFTRPGGPTRCVLRFDAYVRDLEGSLARVYQECLDQAPPAQLPRLHAPRPKARSFRDRTLEEVGVDRAALEATLADYRAWCRGELG
jgi:hypothetical protein